MNKIMIITDADVDVKECRRALLDYLKKNQIRFTKVDACGNRECEHWKGVKK